MNTRIDEDYLKEIYKLQLNHEQVNTSTLMKYFGFSPATVMAIIKNLAAQAWETFEPYQGATSTEINRSLVMQILKRLRLFKNYLNCEMDIPLELIHTEVGCLEHFLSDYLEAHFDEILVYPGTDLYGVPISVIDGKTVSPTRLFLSDLTMEDPAVIVEINDQNTEFLIRVGELELFLSAKFSEFHIEPYDRLIIKLVTDKPLTLGRFGSNQIIVRTQLN